MQAGWFQTDYNPGRFSAIVDRMERQHDPRQTLFSHACLCCVNRVGMHVGFRISGNGIHRPPKKKGGRFDGRQFSGVAGSYSGHRRGTGLARSALADFLSRRSRTGGGRKQAIGVVGDERASSGLHVRQWQRWPTVCLVRCRNSRDAGQLCPGSR